MAEESGQERTEAPTQRRRDEARQQGRIASSADLYAGAVVLAGVILLVGAAPTLGRGLRDAVRVHILGAARLEPTADGVANLFADLFGRGFELLGTFFGLLALVGVLAGVAQVGFHLTPELIEFKWEKINPATNFERLFSTAALVRGLAALAKVAAIGFLAYFLFQGRLSQIATVGEGGLAGAVGTGWAVAMRLALFLAAALFVVGALDYGYQRYRLEQSLKMTREELKEELKRDEGDPQIKGRIRRLQREAAQRRMLQQVPKATVVITNPTHLAVALRYERGTSGAPVVVAKGAGWVAERIVATARRHGVGVVQKSPLAQALYRTAEVDREIPAALYQAVAEILAYLYRLRGVA